MSETLSELQSQRNALKENLQDVNQNIKKLTGRDPAESRRLSTSRRFQLKRNSAGNSSNSQPPEKRSNDERRRWGSTAITRTTVMARTTAIARTTNNLDSGGEEEEEKKPAVHSSVVATGKPIEAPQRPVVTDTKGKNRNRRMLGVLMGTLRQFKKESQVKSEQEVKREEKLIKVEEKVQKDKEDAIIERKELYQTRRSKQDELRKLEFKIEMAELNVELKAHYANIKDFIQLKSTPRLFYKPAKHNAKTLKMLEESQENLKDSLEQRLKEIEMCTEEDMIVSQRSQTIQNRRHSRVSKDVTVIEPVQSKRDLFAEDADDDQRERDADIPKDIPDTPIESRVDKEVIVISDNKDIDMSYGKGLNGSISKGSDIEVIEIVPKDFQSKTIDTTEVNKDSRRVISDQGIYSVVDERVVELSQDDGGGGYNNVDDSGTLMRKDTGGEDDVNIYEDMQQDIDLFQADDIDLE